MQWESKDQARSVCSRINTKLHYLKLTRWMLRASPRSWICGQCWIARVLKSWVASKSGDKKWFTGCISAGNKRHSHTQNFPQHTTNTNMHSALRHPVNHVLSSLVDGLGAQASALVVSGFNTFSQGPFWSTKKRQFRLQIFHYPWLDWELFEIIILGHA